MDVGCTKIRGARKRRKNEDGEYEGGKIDWDSEWVQEVGACVCVGGYVYDICMYVVNVIYFHQFLSPLHSHIYIHTHTHT